jgi:hypothetical protein
MNVNMVNRRAYSWWSICKRKFLERISGWGENVVFVPRQKFFESNLLVAVCKESDFVLLWTICLPSSSFIILEFIPA